MDGNKDVAVKCFHIGKQALQSGDRTRALKFLSKACRLDPTLSGADDLLSEIQNGDQSDSAVTGGVTDEVYSPSKHPTVRHRVSDKNGFVSSSSSSSVAYTEEQISMVRQIRKKKDYYELWGVAKSCTVEDVRKAYRKLSGPVVDLAVIIKEIGRKWPL